MTVDKFIVCAPPYMNGSAGVIVLHELCDALIKLGYEAYILIMSHTSEGWDFHCSNNEKLFNPMLSRKIADENNSERIINEILDDGFCIYPEVVQGNPLNAKNVVRYFLYHDGRITGENSNYRDDDFIVSYSPIYIKNSNFILFKPIVDDAMSDIDAPDFSKRTLDLTYFGKGINYANCFLIGKSVELTKDWPSSKSQLANLLKNVRYLYTWDNHSSISVDALYCGARPVLIQKNQFYHDKSDTSFIKYPPHLWLEINNGVGSIENPFDFESKRLEYIKYIEFHKSQWVSRVEEFVNSVKIHFLMR